MVNCFDMQVWHWFHDISSEGRDYKRFASIVRIYLRHLLLFIDQIDYSLSKQGAQNKDGEVWMIQFRSRGLHKPAGLNFNTDE